LAKNAVHPNSFKLLLNESQENNNKESESLLKASDSNDEQLQKNNVECRPLICGSMSRQPFFYNLYICLKNNPKRYHRQFH
jgi:hypothetical protein